MKPSPIRYPGGSSGRIIKALAIAGAFWGESSRLHYEDEHRGGPPVFSALADLKDFLEYPDEAASTSTSFDYQNEDQDLGGTEDEWGLNYILIDSPKVLKSYRARYVIKAEEEVGPAPWVELFDAD